MMSDIKLTAQETKVIAFLTTKGDNPIHWEELAQFAKDPQTVKLKTIQKVISDLKKKYLVAGVPFPYNGKFSAMNSLPKEEPKVPPTIGEPVNEATNNDGTIRPQVLVQVKRTPAGTVVRVDGSDNAKPMAQLDFVLDPNTRRVRTRYGFHLLNEREWDMMKYLYVNVGRVIRISELRDKVVYPLAGSKTPARWFDHVKAIIGNLRAQVPGLKDRIMTVKGPETGYLFQ
jgi:hypothetical protein